MKLSVFLKKYRIQNGLTQTEMADKSGVCYSTYNGIESGRISQPAIKTLRKIAEITETPIQKIMNMR